MFCRLVRVNNGTEKLLRSREGGGGGLGRLAGKFSPPHTGHKYMIELALRHTNEVTLFVADLAGDGAGSIPLPMRQTWLRDHFGERLTVITAPTFAAPGRSVAERLALIKAHLLAAVIDGRSRDFRMIKLNLTCLPIFMSLAGAAAVWDPALEADPREPAA